MIEMGGWKNVQEKIRKMNREEYQERMTELEADSALGEAIHNFLISLSSMLETKELGAPLPLKGIENRNLLEFAEWYYKSQRERKQKELKEIDENERRVKAIFSKA